MFNEHYENVENTFHANSTSSNLELRTLIKIEINEQIQKCKPASAMLRQNTDEIVEILSKCYEDAPEKTLADYVWNYINKDSKFVEVKTIFVSIADTLEQNRQNIPYSKISPEDKISIEKILGKRSESAHQENSHGPSSKKLKIRDPRPVDPAFVPPESMIKDKNFGRNLSAAASKNRASLYTFSQPSNVNKRSAEPSQQIATKSSYSNNSTTNLDVNRQNNSNAEISLEDSTPTTTRKQDDAPKPPLEKVQSINSSKNKLAVNACKKFLDALFSSNFNSINAPQNRLPSPSNIPTDVVMLNSKSMSETYPTSPVVDQIYVQHSDLTRNKVSPSSAANTMATSKSVDFSSLESAAPTNSDSSLKNDDNRKSPPPLEATVSADEEEESDDEMPRHPPRDLSHYSKFISKKAVTPPRNDDDGGYLLENYSEENYQSNDATTAENHEKIPVPAVDNRQNHVDDDEEDSDEDVPRLHPRNLDRHKSPLSLTSNAVSHNQSPEVISTPKPPIVRKSVFDFSDDEVPESQSTIFSDEETAACNAHRRKPDDPHSGNTVASSMQPHETIDFDIKVNMEGANPSQVLVAFPNQQGPCRKPSYLVLEKWICKPDYEDDVQEIFSSFRNSRYLHKTAGLPPEHLFIFDSMLSGIPLETTYKRVRCIDCGFPNDPFAISYLLETEIEEKRNDYVMKNVFICLGLDFLTYDPDEKRARRNTALFFERLLNQITRAFDPRNGLKRYKRSTILIGDNSFLDVTPPKITFITIPQVKATGSSISLNNDIIQMNKQIRTFVEKCKEAAARKRCILEIYDWEKTSLKFDQCTEEHLGKRNDILMNYLSNEPALLMYRPEE